jgi:hypothetical protein
MKFEIDSDQHHFIIEVTRDPQYMPDGQFDIFDQEDLDEQLGDHLAFYQIMIISHPLTASEHVMTHYQGGLLLPTEPEELQDDLGALIDNNSYLEYILGHWKLHE